MAFGKKNVESAGAAEATDEPTAEIEGAALEAEDVDADQDAPEPAEQEEAAPAEEPVAATASAAAPGTDALLSMFQETKSEIDDLAVLVDLAADADLDDILEELRTIRAALGITDAYDEERELAAA